MLIINSRIQIYIYIYTFTYDPPVVLHDYLVLIHGP